MEQVVESLQPRAYPATVSLVIQIYNQEEEVHLLRSERDWFMGEVWGETEVVLGSDGSSDRTLGTSWRGPCMTHESK
jgi:hypothetical protein